jgi:phenylalanine-4-hydroxylase
MNDFNNPKVAALPSHLKQLLVDQHYEHYTPIDQAVWRYVMRQNYHHLKDIAYYPYIPGLKAAGLTIESIPDLQQMNDALGKIGWGAVTVDGFIPPNAFMEFQARRVLVIAADIRSLAHIGYTPAPDIIHESAGHAPIIAEKAYHEYLSYFGSIGTKAIASIEDMRLYEAIRALSILKEKPGASEQEIKQAEELLNFQLGNMGEPSEMALLSRLHWWTVEYGLIGTLDEPKIYGAGLLSSIEESLSCMLPKVMKIPYTIDAVNYPYDITQPQPQLFVTPDFENLCTVLEQFADTMAFRRGGVYGLQRAVESHNTCTVIYSSGLEVSGTFSAFKQTYDGRPAFIKTNGLTQLSYGGRLLKGHGRDYHSDGFSSPVGKLKDTSISIEDDLFNAGQSLALHFESGIRVTGDVINVLRMNGKNVLISFTGCTVTGKDGEMLFNATWGVYDMAVGESIVSVYSGAADAEAFAENTFKATAKTKGPELDEPTKTLCALYQKVRHYRHHQFNQHDLENVWSELQLKYPGDWLCAMEILELIANDIEHTSLAAEILSYLSNKAEAEPALHQLIQDGISLATAEKVSAQL